MMETAVKVQHTFSVALQWDNSANAAVLSAGNRMPLVVTSPAEFGGTDAAWSPEHLLAASLTSCYSTTFFYFARLFKVKVQSFSIDADLEIEKEDKEPFKASRFVLRPHIKFDRAVSEDVIEKILDKTKKYCIISNSLTGEEIIEPVISY